MVLRVLNISLAKPDTDAGLQVSVERMKVLVVKMEETDAAQRAGLKDSRIASSEKRRLRRKIRSGPIAHLVGVGKLAAKEQPGLVGEFLFKPTAGSYVAFRAAARAMQGSAAEHKDILIKYGVSESVLEQFDQLLDQYDAALTLGSNARTAHTGATKQLDALAAELLQVVQVMDARNRLRFQNDPRSLGSWINASTVLGLKKAVPAPVEPSPTVSDPAAGQTPGAGGDVSHAA